MSKRYTWVLKIERELAPLVEQLPDGSTRWKRRPNLTQLARDLGCSVATVHNVVAELFGKPDQPPSATTLARVERAKRAMERRAAQARAVEQTPAAIDLRLARMEHALDAILSRVDALVGKQEAKQEAKPRFVLGRLPSGAPGLVRVDPPGGAE